MTYRDRSETHGIASLSLSTTPTGGVRLHVRGYGVNVQLPPPPFGLPLQMQLVLGDAGSCWTSTFSTARTNDAKGFHARGD